jgi:hypothetical protein
MKQYKEERRAEAAGIATALILIVIAICSIGAILQAIFNVL